MSMASWILCDAPNGGNGVRYFLSSTFRNRGKETWNWASMATFSGNLARRSAKAKKRERRLGREV